MRDPSPAPESLTFRGLLICVAVLLAIKAAWLALDTTVRVFLGDSGSYLHTALTGWIPPDRSFLYGWLIEASAIRMDSIHALLGVQTLFGIASGVLLYVWLVSGLKLRHRLALVCAALFALDPAQVFYERMMMAEATGLLAFLLFFCSLSAYVARGRWIFIPVYAAFGVLAVAFRINLLAVVLVLSLLAPLIRVWTAIRTEGSSTRRAVLLGGAQLLLAAICTVQAHGYYKRWYGELAQTAPGYTANTGIFRLALVAPLIEPHHFRNTGVSPKILDELKLDYRDRQQREGQIWLEGGLIDVLRRHTTEADRAARKISIRAAREHPVGLVQLGLATAADYFNPAIANPRLQDDIGRRPVPPDLVEPLREHLDYDASDLHLRDTPALQWFVLGSGWLTACLFGLVPLALLALWFGRKAPQPELRLLLALTSIGLVTGHVLFSHIVSFRYLHPLPWFVLANLAVLVAALQLRRPVARAGTPSSANSHSSR